VSLVLIQDQTSWDQFIDNSPHGLLFHKWNFLKTIELHSGYELLPYGINKGESLICVIPLFYKKIMGLKLLFSPPPQTILTFALFNASLPNKKKTRSAVIPLATQNIRITGDIKANGSPQRVDTIVHVPTFLIFTTAKAISSP
jgi:hypothetical protein